MEIAVLRGGGRGAARGAAGGPLLARAPSGHPQATGSFERTAAILARDPGLVAAAIRHLELPSGIRLPSWVDLLRRSARPLALDTDASLWFG